MNGPGIRYVVSALLLRSVDAGATVGLLLVAQTRPGIDAPARVAGILGALLTAPHLAGPITGRLLDRTADARRVVAAAAAIYAGALAAAVIVLGRAPLLVPAGFVVVAGLCGPMLTGGLSSLLLAEPTGPTVGQRRGTAVDALTYGVAATSAPALVAVLSGVLTPTGALLLLIGGAGLGALGTLTVPRRVVVPPGGKPGREQHAVSVFRVLWRTGPLRRTAVLTWITALTLAAALLAGMAEAAQTGHSPAWVAASFGLGGLAGAALLTARPATIGADTGMIATTAALVPVLSVLAVLPAGPETVVAFGVLGIVGAPLTVFSMTARGQYAPPAARGRLFVTVSGTKVAFSSAGTALAGLVVGRSTLCLIVGAAAVAATATGLGLLDRRHAPERLCATNQMSSEEMSSPGTR